MHMLLNLQAIEFSMLNLQAIEFSINFDFASYQILHKF